MTHNTRDKFDEIVLDFNQKFYYEHQQRGFTRLRDDVVGWLRTTLHQQLQKARAEERGRILQIVKDVELSYAVNDGRDTSEMFGGQMAACEIRRKINSDIVNQEVNN